jgi:hypothetical protein
MRYLDLLQSSNYENDDWYKGSREKSPKYDHAKWAYERTKKGCRVTWLSPVFGLRSGKLLIDLGDGWVLVERLTHPGSWVWVHTLRLDTRPGEP